MVISPRTRLSRCRICSSYEIEFVGRSDPEPGDDDDGTYDLYLCHDCGNLNGVEHDD